MDPLDRQSAPPGKGSTFLPRLMVVLVGIMGFGLAWLVGSAVIPRWWAQRLGDTIDGRLIFGSFLGFALGSVFTILPLVALAIGWRFRRGWRRALVAVVLAILLASPNLATLGIVVGSGNAAHAGERILDVDGPGLRGGSLVGAVVGASLTFGVLFLSASRRRNKRRAKDLKARIDDRTSESQPTAGR